MCLERREIERYLAKRQISYRTDSTNLEDDYTRNRIRHHILSYAQREISPKAVAHMCRTADLLTEAEEFLREQTGEAKARCVMQPPGDERRLYISVQPFAGLHIILKKRLILELIQQLAPEGRDISSVHVEAVLHLFEIDGGSRVCLPFGIRAVRKYERVALERGEEAPASFRPFCRTVERLPEGDAGSCKIDLENGERAEISVFFVKTGQKIPGNLYTKWFDCDKIKESLAFRTRRKGDYLTIADGEGEIRHKSLKEYMITEKIPRDDRDGMLLLADGAHVLWLAGYRISEFYKVSKNTKRILQVKLSGGRFGGGTEEEDGGTHQGTFAGGEG